MRALIVLAGVMCVASAFAADTQVKNSAKPAMVASADAKEVKNASKSTKTAAPARVWTVEMSCCEPQ